MSRVSRIILNGKRAANDEVRAAVGALRDRGHEIDVRVTWEGGDAARLAREALRDGIDRLVVGGGDGTINEVLNGLFEESTAPAIELGFLPLGTANDFARGCGIPLQLLDALTLALEGETTAIDVGQANDRFFLNVASGGIGAEITATTPPDLKRIIGGGAYLVMGMIAAHKLEPYQGQLVGPDGTEEGAVIVLAVGNGRQAGGGVPVTSHAKLDDGLLDLFFVRDFPAVELSQVLAELQDLGNTNNRFVYYRQFEEFHVEGVSDMPINLDGEPCRWKEVHFRCLPGALRAVLPSKCLLLSSANS
jgi:lipid kinase YegS